jgi:putative endonuclease
MWSVYVLRSLASAKHYVGMTEDVENRVREHNAGTSKFTSGHCPWQLIYQEDGFQSSAEARIREKYLKTAAGKRFITKKLSAE